jgi:hypothetical protein
MKLGLQAQHVDTYCFPLIVRIRTAYAYLCSFDTSNSLRMVFCRSRALPFWAMVMLDVPSPGASLLSPDVRTSEVKLQKRHFESLLLLSLSMPYISRLRESIVVQNVFKIQDRSPFDRDSF